MDVNTLLKAFVLSGMSIAGFAGAQSVNALDIGLLINNHKIETSNFSTGIYYLKINTSIGEMVKKIVIK